MKVLLVGPFPPPHGGVSVHVASARRELIRQGAECRVLNTDPRASESLDYIRIRGGVSLLRQVCFYAARGWILHVHTNGHTLKGWMIALVCGIVSAAGAGGLLTLHSGMTASYIKPPVRRLLARFACNRYRRVICVSRAIRRAIQRCGVPARRLTVLPAYLPCEAAAPAADFHREWMQSHRPILSTVLSFRHEYGLDLLIAATQGLRAAYPDIGVLVMGGGDKTEAEARIAHAALGKSVLLPGDVPHALCLSLISQCDLFVRPTRADGDAISVREALALGKPVVASDVCARPVEVVTFRSEDAGDLRAVIDRCLSGRLRPHQRPTPRGELPRQRLLDLYASVNPIRTSRAWEG